MEKYLKNLNKEQLQAVTSDSQYIRVIAGAGSGKTRVLTTRIAYLIDELGISPSSILAITFTNKAAREMKERIEKLLDGRVEGMHISTIHSFCVTLLRQEIRRENYPTNFTILDADDQKSIIKEAVKSLGLDIKDYKVEVALDYIANNKTAGISVQAAKEFANSFFYEQMAKIYEYYINRCHELYGLDFDDLILWSNKILKKYPDVRAKWQRHYQYILVDEFQDIDRVQNELIELLSSEDTHLYVVGDPDQTIYTWRGADINIIMGFEKRFPKCQTIILKQNYRSTGMILSGANSLIKYNKNRVKKDLFTTNEDGDKIQHFTAVDDHHEAEFVVSRINKLINSGQPYNSIAVLYRSSYLSKEIEKQLMNFKIPYIIYGGVRFYERAEIKDMLSYLRLLTVGDDLAFKRVINNPKRGIGDKSVQSLFELSRQHHVSLLDSVQYFEGSPKTKERIENFVKQVINWKERMLEQSLEETFQMVLSESGYRAMLETSQDPKDEEKLDNVKELLNDIVGFSQSYPEASLEDYLSNVALYTDLQTNSTGESISLMTVHAAKGLEFDNVIVIGLMDDVFPSSRSVQEGGQRGLEEERRLAYVAFTRARKTLLLTDNTGYSFINNMTHSSSRFINEIDEEFIVSAAKKMVEEKKSEPSFFSLAKSNSNGKKSTLKYHPGDFVVHEVFGEGVVISVDVAKREGTIAFNYPYKTKRLALDFPKLHKKEEIN